MLNILIIIAAVILLSGLLYFEKEENRKGLISTKTILSCLFIVTAVVQPHSNSGYYYLLLMGLLFCLAGDIFLALPQERMFLCGLVSFLIGHVFFVICFFYVADVNQWSLIGAGIGVIVSGIVFLWLRSHLGSMMVPVIVYIIVITAMVVGAWTIFGDGRFSFWARLLVFIGALSFYLSDIFVARDRFLKNEFMNRLLGLPLYYAAQFMLAFSVAFI